MRSFANGCGGVSSKAGASKEPRPVGQRMDSFDFASFRRQPQRLRGHLQKTGGTGKIEPRFNAAAGRSKDRDVIV